MGRAILVILLIVVLVAIAGFATGFFDARQTQEGALPKISVEGGQLPKFDVDSGSVNVGTSNTTVEVPKVETKTEQVKVPTLEVEKAN